MVRFPATILCLLLSLPGLSEEDVHFFEKHIRPALIEHCYECHSEEKKVKGGLLLDRRAGWQTGGDSGPALTPGDPEDSLLIEAIRYGDPDVEMPPKGKLPDAVIARFEEWVRRGAPDPRDKPAESLAPEGIDFEKAKEFWSFRPVTAPEVPGGTATNPVDRFLEHRLRQEGLEPAPATTPEMRLRRAKTDLTGFLPTLAEQDEFLADPSDENFARMVDRWLDDPAFGERWGRHWLDLARYADTSGGGRAMPLPDAWRFRDFVIEAFAEDLPLDELIRLHLAGDLLPHDDLRERERNLVATGFLVLGPHNYENQNKVLLELEIADEQVDTIGRSFLGMTIGCARCHDHKFDPIPTSDYYSMAGIFLSTDSVTHSNVSRWHTEPIPPTETMRKARREYLAEKADLERTIRDLKRQLAGLGRGSGGKSKTISASALPGLIIDNTEAELVGEWMESTFNARFVGDHYLHDMQLQKGAKEVRFRHRFQTAGHYELRLSYSSGSNRNPKTPVTVALPGDIQRRFEVNQILKPEHDQLFETIGEFEVKSGEEITVTIGNDSPVSGVVIADAIQWLPVETAPPAPVPGGEREFSRRQIEQLEGTLRKAENQLKALNKAAPTIPTAMCAVDRVPGDIGDTEVRIRGVEDNIGPVAPRGFLRAASWEEPVIPGDSSGRLELARWITDPRNPLTSRVLANRIWLHLMGRGIVPSPDNFGTTGEKPSHPALLDYLASRLVGGGWSTKKLIRLIMLSGAYSRSSEASDHPGRETDPGNHLYWRAHRRFLDAEAMRDGILHLSGSLDSERGGPSLPEGFKSEFGYRFRTTKRSVYVPVFRNTGYELFNLFDFANPNFTVGRRSRSTIPTQALFLTNSPFIHEEAANTAARILGEASLDDRARVIRLFREILGRPPSADELRLSLDYLRAEGDAPRTDDAGAWAGLVRSLFACVDYRILK